jgi:magnesium transporter
VLTVIEFPESGPARELEQGASGPPAGTELLWLDIEAPTPELLEQLRAPYGLHPLAIEDCLTFDQRPKLEEYPGHVFVVIHELSPHDTSLHEHEVHAFLGKQFLITVHNHDCQRVEVIRQHVIGDATLHARGIGFVYYLLADAVATHNATTLDAIAETIDEVEDSIFEVPKSNELPHIFELKRALAAARRTLSPQRDVFATLSRLESHLINERTAFYFRDVYDKLARSTETIEAGRDLLSSVLEAHFSLVSQRTNEIVKYLTILSAIFLPLSFITGFFGQNFEGLPFSSRPLMWAVLGLYVLLPPGMLFWFRKKTWL